MTATMPVPDELGPVVKESEPDHLCRRAVPGLGVCNEPLHHGGECVPYERRTARRRLLEIAGLTDRERALVVCVNELLQLVREWGNPSCDPTNGHLAVADAEDLLKQIRQEKRQGAK